MNNYHILSNDKIFSQKHRETFGLPPGTPRPSPAGGLRAPARFFSYPWPQPEKAPANQREISAKLPRNWREKRPQYLIKNNNYHMLANDKKYSPNYREKSSAPLWFRPVPQRQPQSAPPAFSSLLWPPPKKTAANYREFSAHQARNHREITAKFSANARKIGLSMKITLIYQEDNYCRKMLPKSRSGARPPGPGRLLNPLLNAEC